MSKEPESLLRLLNNKVMFPFGAMYPKDENGNWPYWSPNGIHYGEDHYAVFVEDIVLHEGRCRVGNDGTGWGLFLEVTHPDKWRTIIAHLSKVYVKTGDYVEAGQIAYVTGDSGSAKNQPHSHLEVRVPGVKYEDTGPKWQQDPNRYYLAGVSEPPVNVEEQCLVSSDWIVVSDWVYVRVNPNTQSLIVGTLKKGARIKAEKIVGGINQKWVQVKNGYGVSAWVNFYHGLEIHLEPVC